MSLRTRSSLRTSPTEDDSYGWFIATSSGKVLQAGPSAEMHWITTTGAGSITAGRPAGLRWHRRMEGNAVYYDTDQVLTLGGAAHFTGTNCHQRPRHEERLRHQPRQRDPAGDPGRLHALSPDLLQQRGPAQRPGPRRRRPD